MNFLSKTKESRFEKSFSKGFNHGTVLIKNIPVHLQETALFTLHSLINTQPKNIGFQGIYHGFSRAMMREKEHRMNQIKAIEQGRSQESEINRSK